MGAFRNRIVVSCLVLLVPVLVGCGARSGGSGSTGYGSAHGEVQSAQRCDYSGSSRFTCGAGLVCCYEPPAPDGWGRCTSRCPAN
jgi:hypothetical protein